MAECIRGRKALETLAKRFPQLYVAPAEGAEEANQRARGMGIAPENANLDHFVTSEEDELREVDALAGPVEVLFLKQRCDFEMILQIIGKKSRPEPIARTVGAITYRGLADWGAVAKAHAAYLAQGGTDWPDEFARLAKIPGTFRAELVIISEGPYSNVPSSETPYGEEEWLHISREIRLHHECAHVVCRRTMPDDILPVWDEITADTVGLLCAIRRYDVALAARFLGVEAEGYSDGRLAEYLDEDQKARINTIAVEVYDALGRIEELSQRADVDEPFAFLLDLKSEPMIRY